MRPSVEVKPRLLLTGWPKLTAIKRLPVPLIAAVGDAEFAAGRGKSLCDHVGKGTAACLPDTEAIVIITAAARLPDKAHDVRRPLRHVSLQPFLENLFEFMG